MRRILSLLFPVRMPRIERIFLQNGGESETLEEGGIGKPKVKQYKDAIERHWVEENLNASRVIE